MSFRTLTGLALAAALIPLAAPIAASAQGGPPKPPEKPVMSAPRNMPTNSQMTSKKALVDVVPPTEADWRTPNPDNLLVIDTNKGRVIVEMYPLLAPASVERIQVLARRHFYDGLTFFRVIDDFMDQTGDPQNTGTGGSDLPNLKGEFTFRRTDKTPLVLANDIRGGLIGFIDNMPVGSQSDDLMAMTADGSVTAWPLFCQGVAAMARAGDVDSANSQFFLMRGVNSGLTRKYAAWGRVIAGQDVVEQVKTGEPVEAPQDKMTTVRLASDMPVAERPKIQVLDTHSQTFKTMVAKSVSDLGNSFSSCEVPIRTRNN